MKSFLSRRLVIGATAGVLLVGAGGAVAATQLSGSSSRQAYIDDVAKHLSVTPSALIAAMKAAAVDRIDAAVAAGRLTPAQATALKQRTQQGDGLPFLGHRFGAEGPHGGLGVAAHYLAISETTLRSDLRSGKSLAQVASSTSGKSVAGLKAAITAADKTRLDSAVSSGRITSQEEQQRLAELSGRIGALLTRTWHDGAGPGFGFGPRRR